VLGRYSIVLTLIAVAGLLLAACAVQQEQPEEEAAEEAGAEEPKSSKAQQEQEAKAKGPQVFEDLAVGDSAEFQNGLSVTVTASHLPAEESVGAQKGREKEKRAREDAEKDIAKGREPKSAPPMSPQDPRQYDALVIAKADFVHAGPGQPVSIGLDNFQAKDENGYRLETVAPTQAGLPNPAEWQGPLEQGQERTGYVVIGVSNSDEVHLEYLPAGTRGTQAKGESGAARAEWVLGLAPDLPRSTH
jgi:hypothetical protein